MVAMFGWLREAPRFALEPRQAVWIREQRRQNLDRDVAAKRHIPGSIDLAHATGAESRHDSVRPELLPGRQGVHRHILGHVLRNRRRGRGCQEVGRRALMLQQLLHVAPYGHVARACPVQILVARVDRQIERRLADPFDLACALRRHCSAPSTVAAFPSAALRWTIGRGWASFYRWHRNHATGSTARRCRVVNRLV
jgi:hypothetical protein